MTLRWLADTAERAGKTFLQAYLAFWVALEGASVDNLFTKDALDVAALATAGVVLLALGGLKIGAKDSASLLPANVDPPQAPDHDALTEAVKRAMPRAQAATVQRVVHEVVKAA